MNLLLLALQAMLVMEGWSEVAHPGLFETHPKGFQSAVPHYQVTCYHPRILLEQPILRGLEP